MTDETNGLRERVGRLEVRVDYVEDELSALPALTQEVAKLSSLREDMAAIKRLGTFLVGGVTLLFITQIIAVIIKVSPP